MRGGEVLELAGMEIDVLFTPGHSPGHVTYAPRAANAIFSGDVLFQSSIGRTDLPGGDHAQLLATIAGLIDRFDDETQVLPGHMGVTTLGPSARAIPSSPSSPAASRMAGKIQAPRGTFDVLPEEARGRAALEETARSILEPAGYGRIETPVFEGTELFARGVGESTDIVQKEMYTFEDGGGRSLTLRPEGTAPICRAYVEHGMHKLPQPAKLWYLSGFFRYERAQAGRYRQFWQIGAEAIGSDDPAVDAELITLLATLLDAVGVRRAAAAGQPRLA